MALNYLNNQAKSYREALAAKIEVDGSSIVLGIGVFELHCLNGADCWLPFAARQLAAAIVTKNRIVNKLVGQPCIVAMAGKGFNGASAAVEDEANVRTGETLDINGGLHRQ